MKRFIFPLITASLLWGCSVNQKTQKTDLQQHWDTLRPLANPDKGWYHHYFDNGIDKYLISSDSILSTFPGMDHLYLRLCWAYLEPEEGKFDWSYIDNIVQKYVPLGYGISFRISTKETGEAPGSVPKEINKLREKLRIAGNSEETATTFEIPDSGNKKWMPGEITLEKYAVSLNDIPRGKYQFSIQLSDEKSGRPVELGLNSELKDVDGFFNIAEINF